MTTGVTYLKGLLGGLKGSCIKNSLTNFGAISVSVCWLLLLFLLLPEVYLSQGFKFLSNMNNNKKKCCPPRELLPFPSPCEGMSWKLGSMVLLLRQCSRLMQILIDSAFSVSQPKTDYLEVWSRNQFACSKWISRRFKAN